MQRKAGTNAPEQSAGLALTWKDRGLTSRLGARGSSCPTAGAGAALPRPEPPKADLPSAGKLPTVRTDPPSSFCTPTLARGLGEPFPPALGTARTRRGPGAEPDAQHRLRTTSSLLLCFRSPKTGARHGNHPPESGTAWGRLPGSKAAGSGMPWPGTAAGRSSRASRAFCKRFTRRSSTRTR